MEEQISGFLREADAGTRIKDLFMKHSFSEPSYYVWKAQFGGMSVSDEQRLKTLESENTKLKKKLLANSMLEIDAIASPSQLATVPSPGRGAWRETNQSGVRHRANGRHRCRE